MNSTPAILTVAATLALVVPCSAQIETLTPVEPGVSDVNPMARDLRVQPADYRQPFGYDVLYQGTWNDPLLGIREIFARRSGAITAVFPRSNYRHTENGVIAEIPAGTIFYFGEPEPVVKEQDDTDQGVALSTVEGRIDLRVDLSVPAIEDRVMNELTQVDGIPTSIWADESYRQARVHRLLLAANRSPLASEEESIEP